MSGLAGQAVACGLLVTRVLTCLLALGFVLRPFRFALALAALFVIGWNRSAVPGTVILRELVLGPGDTFSTVLMKISQLRLDNTRFFESADVISLHLPGGSETRGIVTAADLARRCGVLPRHLRLLSRLLQILEEDGILRRQGDGQLVTLQLHANKASPPGRKAPRDRQVRAGQPALPGRKAPMAPRRRGRR